MDEALKKLRIKFVTVIMAVVTIILTIAFSIIVSLSYAANTEEVSLALEEAVDHARMLKEPLPFDKAPHEDERIFDKELPRFEIGGRSPERSLIPIAVYELDGDGSLALISSAASGTMTESLIDDAGHEALQLADGEGFLDSLGVYYLKESYDDDVAIIAFADEQSIFKSICEKRMVSPFAKIFNNSCTLLQLTMIESELWACLVRCTWSKYSMKLLRERSNCSACSASVSAYKAALSYSFCRRLLTLSA